MELAAAKKDIRGLSSDQLTSFFTENGEKAYRAKQVYEWLWSKSAKSFEEMTNLSSETRKLLSENFYIHEMIVDSIQISKDGTIKVSFQLYDGNLVEGVLIPTERRITACISSQVGCSLSCKFCATGFMERKRNLDAGEIYDQVVLLKKIAETEFDKPITNIVYMGMGEPLLNFQNVMKSIQYITGEKGLNMASKRITVSTAGISKMISKLAEEAVPFNLALSLHAANDEKRNQIMPINETNNLQALQAALLEFNKKAKGKITFEYIVFKDFNDSISDAIELYEFARKLPVKINLIEYNPIQESNYSNTTYENLNRFSEYLENKGLIVNVRKSRGKDIDAACGQLANKKTKTQEFLS